MRILILSNITPYRIGGAENQARLLAEQFASRGHDVTIAGYAVPKGRWVVPGVPGRWLTTIHLPTIRVNRLTRALSFSLSLSVLLLLRKKTYDMVYCRFIGESILVAAFLKYAGFVQKPLMACSEGAGDVGDAAFINSLPGTTGLVSLLNRACCAINVLSPKIAEELTALGINPELFTFIPNGVRLPPGQACMRSCAGGRQSILFAGRLVPQKGVADLLRAAQIIGKKGLMPVINIVGDGPLLGRLQDLAKELAIDAGVVFHGQVLPQQMADHYRANDVLVLPSRQEGQSMVVTEAMSFGLPIIVTCSGGPENFPPDFMDDQNGITCPPGNADALAAAMEKFLRMPDWQRTAMGQNGRQKVEGQFDIENVADRFLEQFFNAVPED